MTTLLSHNVVVSILMEKILKESKKEKKMSLKLSFQSLT